MNDKVYTEFQKELKQAIKETLTELMLAGMGHESVDIDELALAVQAKFKKVEWGSIIDGIMILTKSSTVEQNGFACRLSIMDMLASL
jgi:hypothetical protein